MKLSLKNFQRFESLSLDFEPGFCCIIGKSNTGKSSLIRALFLVLRNTYSPSFLRKGTSSLSISLDFDTLHVTLTKPSNTYLINGVTHSKAARNPLNSFLSQPSFLYWRGLLDLNLQSQFSGLFLLSESPSLITSFFTEFLGSTRYQTALSLVNKDIQSLSQSLSKTLNPNLDYILQSLSSLSQSLSSLPSLPPFPELIPLLDQYLDLVTHTPISIPYDDLSSLLESYENLLLTHLLSISLPTLDPEPLSILSSLLSILQSPEPIDLTSLDYNVPLDTLDLSRSITLLAVPEPVPEIIPYPVIPDSIICPLCGKPINHDY